MGEVARKSPNKRQPKWEELVVVLVNTNHMLAMT
jgi:hypothetical protein